MSSRRHASIPALWLWFTLIIVIGVVVIGIINLVITPWIMRTQFSATPTPMPPAVTTLQVQRTVSYAGLDITVINAQYTSSFPGDDIHTGAAMVRLNMQVANHSGYQGHILYYSSVHLLVHNVDPISPTNVYLSASPAPQSEDTGWFDFPVSGVVQLNTLSLQLGSSALNETMVAIPFSGSFDAKRYSDRSSPQNALFTYTYIPRPSTSYNLTFHLTRVDVRFAYQGSECTAGQQFYILNFSVDNPYTGVVTPGQGWEYIRLLVNGSSQSPVGSTLPDTFKPGANGGSGQVIFSAPANMHTLTLGFLPQSGGAQQDYGVTI